MRPSGRPETLLKHLFFLFPSFATSVSRYYRCYSDTLRGIPRIRIQVNGELSAKPLMVALGFPNVLANQNNRAKQT